MFVVIIFPQRSRRAIGSHRMVALSVCVCLSVCQNVCQSVFCTVTLLTWLLLKCSDCQITTDTKKRAQN